jgi:hypothetical protein
MDERLQLEHQKWLEAKAQAAGISVDQLVAAILVLQEQPKKPERVCA